MLAAFAPNLQGKRVAWFTDSTSVVSIVHNGSKVVELQSLALSIFNVCVLSGISLEMKWIPWSLNCEADLLSRTVDFDDYTLNDDVFHVLDCKWGPSQWIGFPVVITPSFRVTILDFTSLALRLSTLSPKIGSVKTIGFFHLYRKSVELLRT